MIIPVPQSKNKPTTVAKKLRQRHENLNVMNCYITLRKICS